MFKAKAVLSATLLMLCLPSVGLTATIHVPTNEMMIQAEIEVD